MACLARLAVLVVAALMALLPVDGSARTLRVAVISDLNGGYGSTSYAPRVSTAISRIIELRPDLVLSTGDMVAGQRSFPKLNEEELRAMWSSFHATITMPLRRAGIPFAVTPGNHDASAYDGFALERQVYADEWERNSVPLDFVDRGTFPFAYAFEVDGVLFVSLDGTKVGALDLPQMEWLDRALTKSRGGTRARVVFSHLPLWPFAQRRETEMFADPELEALLQKHGVALHLSGHHHAYYPSEKDGVAYVGQACLGKGARRLIGDDTVSENSFTMVEIGDDGSFEVYALAAPDYAERVDHARLPPRIVSPQATLTRLDIARGRAAETRGEAN